MVSWSTMNFICQLKSCLHNPYLQNQMPLICKPTRMCLIFDGMLWSISREIEIFILPPSNGCKWLQQSARTTALMVWWRWLMDSPQIFWAYQPRSWGRGDSAGSLLLANDWNPSAQCFVSLNYLPLWEAIHHIFWQPVGGKMYFTWNSFQL